MDLLLAFSGVAVAAATGAILWVRPWIGDYGEHYE